MRRRTPTSGGRPAAAGSLCPDAGRPASGTAPGSGLDVDAVREDFPILGTLVRGRPLVYLDNAATTHKPRAVVDALRRYYESDNANVHRGLHHLSERATQAFEEARARAQRFVRARSPREIVFVRGTTEAINLVASTFGRAHVAAGDEVLISAMEHHSNIVPWQMLCQEKGATLRVAPVDDRGDIILEEFERLLTGRTRLVSVTWVSNALGTINPVGTLVAMAHREGVPVLVDAAQAAPHLGIDVQDVDCDFLAFSSHKVYGPTGVGVLYGRSTLLESMPPYQGGGEMIASVSFEKTTYNHIPYKFEAGTPDISGAVGLAAALDYVGGLGIERVGVHEQALLEHATRAVGEVPGVRLIGTARRKASVLSFVVEGIHPHDLGTILDLDGIAIRAGHHCAQPLMGHFGVPATARASLAAYNTAAEVDALVRGIHKAIEVFGG